MYLKFYELNNYFVLKVTQPPDTSISFKILMQK